MQKKIKRNFQILSLYLIFLVSFMLPCNSSYAGAWLQEKGKAQIIMDKYIENESKFSKGYENIFFEYGISAKSNIGFNIYHKKKISQPVNNQPNYFIQEEAIKNFEVFIKKPLYNKNNWVISSQNTVSLISKSYEQKIAIGRSINKLFQGFINIEASYLINNINPLNLGLEFTCGSEINKKIMLLLQSENKYKHHKLIWVDRSPYNGEIQGAKTTIYKSYFSQLKVSTLYILDSKYTFQTGIAQQLNKRTKNKGLFASLWIYI